MPSHRLPRIAAAVGLSLVIGALLSSSVARADEPDRSSWLGDREYRKAEVATFGETTLEIYVAAQEEPPGDAEEAWIRILLVKGGDVVESYRMDATRLEGGHVRLDLRWEDRGPSDPGVLLTISLGAEPDLWVAGAKSALGVALGAAPAWRAAGPLLSQAAAETDPERRRPLALAAYRALERAHRTHPMHVGVLRDLLVADQLLVPLEVGSDRGANLAFLWRDHVAAARQYAQGEDLKQVVRTALVCSIAEGCYAYAATMLSAIPVVEPPAPPEEGTEPEVPDPSTDPELEALRGALVRMGQDQQEEREVTTIVGKTGTVILRTLRVATEAGTEGFPLHRLTFLVATPDRADEPKPTWFSLTCETSGAHNRWALYGWVGGSRRLLRLYGAEEPDGDAVAAEVTRLVRASVRAEEEK